MSLPLRPLLSPTRPPKSQRFYRLEARSLIAVLTERVRLAEERMVMQIQTAIFGNGWLSNDEWREYQRSRSGWRFMLKLLMNLASDDAQAEEDRIDRRMVGLAAWLPSA